jgi:hypothetical protein
VYIRKASSFLLRRAKLLVTISAVAAIATIAGGVLTLATGHINGSNPPNPGSGGREVMEPNTAGEGGLQLTSIASSAFSTTLQATLKVEGPMGTDSVVAISNDAITVEPNISQAHLDGVRRLSPSEVQIVIVGGALPGWATEVAVTVEEYVIVEAGGSAGKRMRGPATARASVIAGPPEAHSSDGAVIEVADGLRWVVDGVAYDGYVLRANYRVEGSATPLLAFPPSPISTTGDTVVPLLGPVTSNPAIVDVKVEAKTATLDLMLPALVRTMDAMVEVKLRRSAAGSFEGTAVVGGASVMFQSRGGDDGPFNLVASSEAGSHIAFTQSVGDVSLIDEFGTALPFSGITGKIADGDGANSTFRFSQRPTPDASVIILRFTGYEVQVAEPTRVTLRLP